MLYSQIADLTLTLCYPEILQARLPYRYSSKNVNGYRRYPSSVVDN